MPSVVAVRIPIDTVVGAAAASHACAAAGRGTAAGCVLVELVELVLVLVLAGSRLLGVEVQSVAVAVVAMLLGCERSWVLVDTWKSPPSRREH